VLFLLILFPLLGGLVGWLFDISLQRSFIRIERGRIGNSKRIWLLNKLSDELCCYGGGGNKLACNIADA